MPKPKQVFDRTVPYRVRDRYVEGEELKVWGDGLPYDDAMKLKEKVVASKQSRTARLEPSSEPLPGRSSGITDLDMGVEMTLDGVTGVKTTFCIEGFDPLVVPSTGMIIKIPVNSELHLNSQVVSVPTPARAGDTAQCRPLDPEMAVMRAKALAAARPVAAAKNAKPYRDRTVRIPVPRTSPPPRDKTVSRQPVMMRLDAAVVGPPKPLASPLKVATQTDGTKVADDVFLDEDLHDLTVNVGGGESDEDVAAAKRARDAQQ